MSGFAHIRQVLVPYSVAERGRVAMAEVGRRGYESMVLWVGEIDGNVFRVDQLVAPKQYGQRTPDGVCVMVRGEDLHELNVALYRSGKRLIAQLHTHPGRAYHSTTDDAHAVATTIGAFSLVIPDFAARPFRLGDCAVYRLDAGAELSPMVTSQGLKATAENVAKEGRKWMLKQISRSSRASQGQGGR